MKNRIVYNILLSFFLLNHIAINAQASLVKDINVGAASSNPSNLFRLNDKIIFVAEDSSNGKELWVSDGTEIGTYLLKDTNPGTSGINIFGSVCIVGNFAYFNVNNSLWKTDGTPSGTVLVKSGFTSITRLTNVNGTVFFEADMDAVNLDELWKSDGTTAGTVVVKKLRPGDVYQAYTSNFIQAPSGNELYFTANDGTGMALWKSNGTTAGTTKIKNFSNTPQHRFGNFVNLNGQIYFAALNSRNIETLWRTDGTLVGTIPIYEGLYFGSLAPGYIQSIGNKIFLSADNQNPTTFGHELWSSDGTLVGTQLIKDINPGNAYSNPKDFIKYQNEIYFTALTVNEGIEFWKTNDTESGTTLVKDFYNGSKSGHMMHYTNSDLDKIYIIADNGTEKMLYESDGTTIGTNPIFDISESNINFTVAMAGMISLNGNLYFVAESKAHGLELWKLDSNLSTSSFLTEKVIMYPNPVKTILTLNIPLHFYDSIQIFNTSGQIVFSQQQIKSKQVNIENLPSGVYIVNVNSNGKIIHSQKIIKQ